MARSTPDSRASLRTIGLAYGAALDVSVVLAWAETCSAEGVDVGAICVLFWGCVAGVCVGGSGVSAEAPTAAAPTTANTVPTGTVSSSATLISIRVPAMGDGISVSTLSVETSRSGSSISTESPTVFSQRVTVPSVTLSPRAGRTTSAPTPPAEGAAGSAVGAACVDGSGAIDAATGSGAGGGGVGSAGTASGVGAAGSAVGASCADVLAASTASPTRASSPPTSTTSSSTALISTSTPATGDGISVSTLSVETSRSGSSISTLSPTSLSQRVTVPSVTLSPSCGIVIETDIAGVSIRS